MNKLYLVRHGENPANLTKELSHRLIDYPLTPKGRLQAEQTAEFFVDKHIDAIFSSPLKRSIETAGIIAHRLGLSFAIIEEFREINMGDLETMPDLKQAWQINMNTIMQWLTGNREAAFPGGENAITACQRFQKGLAQALDGRDDQKIVIVGHGGQFTTCLSSLCPRVDFSQIITKPSSNCSITEIDLSRDENGWQGELVHWADFSHLHGEAAELEPGFPTD